MCDQTEFKRPTALRHLHRIAFVVVHAQNDLDVFGRLLLAAVELSLQQRDVEVVPHVSCSDDIQGTLVTCLSEQQDGAQTTEAAAAAAAAAAPTHLGG